MAKNTVNKSTKKRKVTIRKTRKGGYKIKKGGDIADDYNEDIQILLTHLIMLSKNEELLELDKKIKVIKDIVDKYKIKHEIWFLEPTYRLFGPTYGVAPLMKIAEIKKENHGPELCLYFINAYKEYIANLDDKEKEKKYNEFINAKTSVITETPLHTTIRKKNLDVAKVLIENGADVNSRDGNGQTPLHIAIIYRNFDFIKFLIENGADVNSRDKNGQTPLGIAIIDHKLDFINFLIANGADVNSRDGYGQSLLDIATIDLNHDIVEILIDNGADVNSKDDNDQTPLHHVACLYKYIKIRDDWVYVMNPAQNEKLKAKIIDMINLLLNKGAYILARDKDGHTPTDIAEMQDERYKLADVIKILKESQDSMEDFSSRIARRAVINESTESDDDVEEDEAEAEDEDYKSINSNGGRTSRNRNRRR